MEESRNWYSYSFPIEVASRTCFPKHSTGCSVHVLSSDTWELILLRQGQRVPGSHGPPWAQLLPGQPQLRAGTGIYPCASCQPRACFSCWGFHCLPTWISRRILKPLSCPVAGNFSITCCKAYNELKVKTALKQFNPVSIKFSKMSFASTFVQSYTLLHGFIICALHQLRQHTDPQQL